jgi:hypothetical protein
MQNLQSPAPSATDRGRDTRASHRSRHAALASAFAQSSRSGSIWDVGRGALALAPVFDI